MNRRRSTRRGRDPDNLDAVPFYAEIREALGQAGCPVCRLLSRDAERYLDSVLWELVNDPGVRDELNRARGYCPQHGWLLVRAGAALGVAILTRGVVRTLLDEMAANPAGDAPRSVLGGMFRRSESSEPPAALGDLPRAQPGRSTSRLVEALSPQAPCPVCVRLEPREQDYLRTLAVYLDPPGGLGEVYGASGGLCLDHFRQALPLAAAARTVETLVAAQQMVWERLYGELDEFVRKNDPRFRGEPFGEERDSWRRALEAVSGPPPRSESERGGLTGTV